MFEAIVDTSLRIGDMITMAVDDSGRVHLATLVTPSRKVVCGIAARDMEVGEVVQFDALENTDDIIGFVMLRHGK